MQGVPCIPCRYHRDTVPSLRVQVRSFCNCPERVCLYISCPSWHFQASNVKYHSFSHFIFFFFLFFFFDAVVGVPMLAGRV